MDVQRNYLRNPLPAYPWICPTCRGIRTEGYPLCLRCQSHLDRSDGTIADLVVPISYSPRTGQHHHNLRTYKGSTPSEQAQWSLLAVLLLFLHDHLDCIATTTGARPTHVATVPSTRGRIGTHPLTALIGSRLALPWIISTTNPRYGPDERELHTDRFTPTLPAHNKPVHALILDDTWTTGSRAQSLAYALKTASAATVATIILGRHIDPDYPPSKPLLTAIADPIFDTTRCAIENP